MCGPSAASFKGPVLIMIIFKATFFPAIRICVCKHSLSANGFLAGVSQATLTLLGGDAAEEDGIEQCSDNTLATSRSCAISSAMARRGNELDENGTIAWSMGMVGWKQNEALLASIAKSEGHSHFSTSHRTIHKSS